MSSRRIVVIALVAAAAAGLIAHSLLWNFVTDDAFISFVYSRNLARHGQLVFNLGERVEGYTNFLWTVLLAGLLKVGLAPEVMSRVLGTAAAIGTMITCAFASRRVRANAAGAGAAPEWSAWDALPAIILCGVPGFACWASGGLETALFTFLVTLGVTLYLGEHERDAPSRGSAIAFGLAALTRPEGLLFFALTMLHRGIILVSRRRFVPAAAELRWIGWFALLVVPHLLWRRWYYGWWLPNTFYIKSSGGAGAWSQGAYYLTSFARQFHLWVVPIFAAVGLALKRERGAIVLAGYVTLVAGVFAFYVASVGGDFMGLFRFALPIVPLLALLAAAGLRLALSGKLPQAAQLAIVALLLGAHAWHAADVDQRSLVIGADRGIDSPGYLRWYTADRAAIGKWFGQYARPDDYAAVGGAGAQVYYSDIRSLDCFGLSDEFIAHKVPAQSSRPGHQKYAPLDYQLARKPTIITSNYYRIEGAPYQPPLAEAALWRQRGYRFVSVRVPGLSSPWYTFLLRLDRSLGPIGRGDEID
ncbi:MAG TPA: hypothetical protein VFF06_35350 [Polyangia bacterium]|nr:hypothetical protein [Polyangia bacterium]